jgi:hypothetical protein
VQTPLLTGALLKGACVEHCATDCVMRERVNNCIQSTRVIIPWVLGSYLIMVRQPHSQGTRQKLTRDPRNSNPACEGGTCKHLRPWGGSLLEPLLAACKPGSVSRGEGACSSSGNRGTAALAVVATSLLIWVSMRMSWSNSATTCRQ